MANLKVSLRNIIPLTEARDHFSQIVNEVQRDKLYILTKGGKPVVAIIDVKYLETISGGSINAGLVEEEIQKDPVRVGRTPMIKLNSTPAQPSANPTSFKPYLPSQTTNPASDNSSQPKPMMPEINPPLKPIFGQNPDNSSETDLKTPPESNLGVKPVIPNQTPANGPLKISFQPTAQPAVSSAPISTPPNPTGSPSIPNQLDKPLPKPFDNTPVTPTTVNPTPVTPFNNAYTIPKPIAPSTPFSQSPTPQGLATATPSSSNDILPKPVIPATPGPNSPSIVPTFSGIPTPVAPKPMVPSTPLNPMPSAASTSINSTPVIPNNYPQPVSAPSVTLPSNNSFNQPSNASTPAPQDSISVSNTSPLSDLPPRPVTSPITGPLGQSAPTPTPNTNAKTLVMPTGFGLNNAATMPANNSGNSINVIPSLNNPETPKPNPAPLNNSNANDLDDMALD